MQNTSVIATIPITISPNDYLTEELNENKAGSSDFVLNSVWSIATAVCALLFRGHLHDVVQMSLAGSVFQVNSFEREGGLITFTSFKFSQQAWKKVYHWNFVFKTHTERTVRLQWLLNYCFIAMPYENSNVLGSETPLLNKNDFKKDCYPLGSNILPL